MIEYRLKEQGIDIVDTVLTNRGLTIESAEKLKNPVSSYIESPMLLKNMEKAVNKVVQAMKENKRIVIPIDSDCDGWCSAGQLYHYMKYVLGYENIVYIFHDNPKAHGFTDYIVKELKKLETGLVIMADGGCGESDRMKYQTVLDNGADIVILDHHSFEGEYQEEVALVNCQQSNQESTNVNLSGASVVYKFLQSLSNKIGNQKDVERYQDLVALSLVSDLMDLRELENRALLERGTKVDSIKSPFIKKIIEKKKIDKFISIEELGFSIAPMINATVRIGKKEDKEKVFRSLIITEQVESEKRGEKGKGIFVPLEEEAVRIATNMKSNQDKKRDKAMEKLLSEAEKYNLNNGKVLVANVTEYIDPEIAGLVANKLLDIFNKPVILLRFDKKHNKITASARGIGGNSKIPSFKDVVKASDVVDSCSGHDNAFGLEISLSQSLTNELKKEAENEVQLEWSQADSNSKGKITKEVFESKIKEQLVERILELEDYLNKALKDVDFYKGFEIDAEYNEVVPIGHVKAIANYEELWCNSIKAPLFIVKDVKLDTKDIEKIGNATYTFKIGDVKFIKNYGSKVWFERISLADELPFGGRLVADIVCKFRKNKKGYFWCDIVDMSTREDEDAIDF